MKTHTQVAVIGGGVTGASVLYHLTKKGITDCVLIERDELTSGSTWHAAGGMHTLNSDPFVAKLQKYTIEIYEEIQALSGQNCSIHRTGGFMLADTPERLDYLKATAAKGKHMGIDLQFVDMQEVKDRIPMVDTQHFVGAVWDDNEGHVDPTGVTNAYAKSARIKGAEVYRHTKLESLKQLPDGQWELTLSHAGETQIMIAEKVVNCGGLWAREVGRMVGLELPLIAMEHQYIVTEAVENLTNDGGEMPHIIDFGGEIYMRQEQQGVLLGTYEKNGVPWSVKSTPWSFGHELLQNDLERISHNLMVGYEHFPALAEVGIKTVINGPFTFSPDSNPLVGPVKGLTNFYCACAVMAGFSQAGGIGLALANWIADGDPDMDVYAMDVNRFGSFATPSYTRAKVCENYGKRFSVAYPNEQREAARPHITTPIYNKLTAENAVWGVTQGLEFPLWYAPKGTAPVENLTFRRSNAFEHIGAEVRAVRENVGLIDSSSYARHEISGAGARDFLDKILTNTIPKAGRIALAPMLDLSGQLLGDLTVANFDDNRYFIFGSNMMTDIHQHWFAQHAPNDGSVHISTRMDDLYGLHIAGPNSRKLLAEVTEDDVSAEAIKFRDFTMINIGGMDAYVGRLSFTGELGYELWMAPEHQGRMYDLIMTAGEPMGLKLFGSRALASMRLEKSFGGWLAEYRKSYNAYEAGFGTFVKLDKGDFIGKAQAVQQKQADTKLSLCTFVVEGTVDCDPHGDEPIFYNGEVVGWVTSGGYGHSVGKSIALGYVPTELADQVDFEIDILGDIFKAIRQSEALVDPAGERMRKS
jgi:dimethylglycine dehydrogenase